MRTRWLMRGEGGDHRPSILQPPAVVEGWWTPEGLAWHDVDHLWLPLGGRMVAVELGPPEAVIVEGDRLCAWDRSGRSVVWGGGGLTVSPEVLRLDAGLSRSDGWHSELLRLPWGARRSRAAAPFATGRGVVWVDGPWVQRWRPDQGTRAIGAIAEDEGILVGPRGAVLIGDPTSWTRAAAPHSSVRPLAAPLDRWPVPRWAADGSAVAGVLAGEEVVTATLDLRTGATSQLRDGATPAAVGHTLRVDDEGAVYVNEVQARPPGLPDGGSWEGVAEGGEIVTGPAAELGLRWRASELMWSDDGLLVRAGGAL